MIFDDSQHNFVILLSWLLCQSPNLFTGKIEMDLTYIINILFMALACHLVENVNRYLVTYKWLSHLDISDVTKLVSVSLFPPGGILLMMFAKGGPIIQ